MCLEQVRQRGRFKPVLWWFSLKKKTGKKLLYLEDVDAASIAAIVGITPRNVATKVYRVKMWLARQFHPRGADHA